MRGVVNRFLSAALKRQDLLLVIFLVLIIMMIVIPLPTWLIDIMITINFMLAFLILMVGLYLTSVSEFTTLPAVILMSTLFRLAISISTTRLILLDGDAGQIVETFGQFVVGGSLIVGVIIFLIITVVQFIVITKGAERVAEVGARFSLDAMPGKQMAIDIDVRSGEMNVEQAQKSRAKLQSESQLYGAMDGTMKFVKGDSIAGIVIILVNICGGLAIGVTVKGMSFAEAAELYTILTIGDGLVSQLPALIIAISAGSIVTRVSSSESADLGKEISQQLAANSNALRFAAVILAIFGLIPGFPTFTFLGAAALLIGLSYLAFLRDKAQAADDELAIQAEEDEETRSSPVQLNVGAAIYNGLNQEAFRAAALRERKILMANLGVTFPSFSVAPGTRGDMDVDLTISGVSVITRILPEPETAVLAMDVAENVETTGAKPLDHDPPWHTIGATWVAPSDAPLLRDAGIPVLAIEDVLARMAAYAMPQQAEYFVGVQETRFLLNRATRRYPDLVEEALENAKLAVVAEVLQNLVVENVSIRDMRSILEGIVKWAPKEKDPEILLEYVRSHMAKQISAQVSPDARTIFGVVLSPETEDMLRDCTKVTNVGSYMSLSSAQREAVISAIRSVIDGFKEAEGQPTLITAMDTRRLFRRFLLSNQIFIPVISQRDIAPDFRVQVLGEVNI